MKACYKNDLKQAFLVLKAEERKEDYQVIMLRENEIPGVLKLEVRNVDNESHYYYNISGKTSFQTLHEKVSLNYEEMKKLVQTLLATIQELQGYMLDGNCLLLQPEYIFCDKERFYFCYYPAGQQNVKEAFHKLTEFFVREVDYRDDEGIHFAYSLHKATMEENYSVAEIMRDLTREPEGEAATVVDYVEQMEEPNIEYDIIEEKKTIWAELPRKLFRRRLSTVQ